MPVAAITGLGKTVLLIVAITFIAWALVTAIFVPKRSPGFPLRLDAYILVSVVLFIAQMSAVVWVTGTQETEEETHAAETGGGTTEGGTTTEAPAGDAAAGKQVFESAGCVACHTLADAGSTGTVGPNLDDAKPAATLVVTRVTDGSGAMPSFKDKLTEQQIQDVAAYVSSVAGTS
ncbi:MAG TPA: c-type cytochrome [Gaiella sp.]|nr:c-type cytochrome [Gaiella sp.]